MMRRARRATAPRARRNLKSTMAGNLKAAFQQRDSTQVVLNATETVQLAIPANTNGATTVRNVTKLLCGTEFFQHYAGMYDQFKIDGVSVSAEIVYNTFGQAAMTFPNVITAWDRNGIDKATANVVTNPEGGQNLTNVPIVPGPYQVSSYSSAVSRAYYPGARWGITRRLIASSLQEKSIYLPTVKTAEVLTESTLYAAWNPDFLLSVLLGNQTATCQTLVFNLTWSWVVSLRGLRKSTLDVIPIPNANSLGYAGTNAGTVASGTNNTMIPASMTVDNNAGVVTVSNPVYTTQVQNTGGVTSVSNNSWTVDALKMYLNEVMYNIGVGKVDAITFDNNNLHVVEASNAGTAINLPAGSSTIMPCVMVAFATTMTLGNGTTGYNLTIFLCGNGNSNAHVINVATDANTFVVYSEPFAVYGINLPNQSGATAESVVTTSLLTTVGSTTTNSPAIMYANTDTTAEAAVNVAAGSVLVVAGTNTASSAYPVVKVLQSFVTAVNSNDGQVVLANY
ncbi:hypothetical protein EDI_118690 [Entamoeba dispar SAW760]|uniref:Uncharacterized protein n=1 Tax=Entamoeba dispar (strain ATCC PRA-260 / SAW760) TaxID=370354 RepID=B0E9U7_ENTDS|nr:uncharacterized protein EDI_118690 [Entamoeba dispar SAW760]EDR28692.1 hypothetical protein EDI_118690 [Entamoeba dispar SAW760]|eukprot:EDR28692.1 hypothetical protein EDI_118690 [Entamoeba dispar SAW760]